MTDTPVSIAEARWDRCSRTDEQSVVDMLRAALAKIERGEIKPDHAFLCLGEVAAYPRGQHPHGCPDDYSAGEMVDLTVGDFRRARTVYAKARALAPAMPV